MGGRKRSIKFKILTLVLVPLVSLVGIWAFAATITIQNGLDLLKVRTVFDNTIVPARALMTEIEQERYLSLMALGSRTSDRGELDAQRARSDQARATLERLALAEDVQKVTSAPLLQRVTELITVTRRLPEIRARVDSGSFTRLLTLDAYRLITDAISRVYDKLALASDSQGEPTRAIVLIGRSRELMSEQSALLAGAVAAGSITGEERTTFTAMVIKRRLLYDMGFQRLDEELRQPYLMLQNSPVYAKYASIEDQVTQDVRPGRPLPGAAATWGQTLQTLNLTFDKQAGASSQKIADRALPLVATILWQIVIAAGLGLVAVAVSLFVSVRFGRLITAELVQLQAVALDLANRKLPAVVRRLRQGEDVDVASETPPIPTGTTTEIAIVGQAFTSVQTTAIEAAVGQAEIRKGVSKVFLNLARRNQSLLHRQLSMLDSMEQRVTDPELLDELFGIDHLTTRMRRHAEGLIILSGAVPGRGWRRPVPLYDVVRAAVEEVEDYLRVHVAVPENMALSGSSATDVIHLLAELVENATIFSPPQTHVEIRGELVARGFVIEVEDRGLGMTLEEMEQVNRRLADPPEFDLADSDRLGLFVVGRLAARRGIRVSLRPSPYGGTTAIVLVPEGLVTPAETGPDQYSVEQISAVEAGFANGQANGNGNGLDGGERGLPAGAESGPGNGNGKGNGSKNGNGNGRDGGRAAGLPHRVRQANLAPQLRDAGPQAGGGAERAPRHLGGPLSNPLEDPLDAPPLQPSPDMFSSFRAGWERAHEGEGNMS
ncbi:nitrate- and nitrite sensing domain-containing protein [Sphaerisporangium viridialbum]|uniref:sensor histidine kinase n=1 Tax=Sphaerisporangium viridialbum TaxID=46189 RepID=UPI003C75222D